MATTSDPFGVPAAVKREGFSLSGFERDLLMLNRGNGSFFDISSVSGADSISDGRAGVYADFDNDGDKDIFITSHPSEMRRRDEKTQFLYRNNVGQENGFLRIALEGRQSGRDAWGTVVRVKTSAGILTQVKSAGSGFLSQSDPRLLFGLKQDRQAEWVEVTWPTGAKKRFEGPRARTSWKITEGENAMTPVKERATSLPNPLPVTRREWKNLAFQKGDSLPDLTLSGPAGETQNLRELVDGTGPVLLHFWATWCSSCKAEMRELQRLKNQWKEGGGPIIIGINVDDQSTRKRVPRFLRKARIQYPNYTTRQEELSRVYSEGEVSVPLALLVTKEGRVQEAFTGWTGPLREVLKALAKRGGNR